MNTGSWGLDSSQGESGLPLFMVLGSCCLTQFTCLHLQFMLLKDLDSRMTSPEIRVILLNMPLTYGHHHSWTSHPSQWVLLFSCNRRRIWFLFEFTELARDRARIQTWGFVRGTWSSHWTMPSLNLSWIAVTISQKRGSTSTLDTPI